MKINVTFPVAQKVKKFTLFPSARIAVDMHRIVLGKSSAYSFIFKINNTVYHVSFIFRRYSLRSPLMRSTTIINCMYMWSIVMMLVLPCGVYCVLCIECRVCVYVCRVCVHVCRVLVHV